MARSSTSTCAAGVPAGSTRRGLSLVAALLGVLTSCRDATSPAREGYTVAIYTGDAQFGLPSALLELPLEVSVREELSGDPVEGVRIEWHVVEGSGASPTPAESVSDEDGIAATRLRLGADTGTYRVEARGAGMVGAPPVLVARAVLAPVIESIQPQIAPAGGMIAIQGRNFSPVAGQTTVVFGGIAGLVTSATTTALQVRVPACAPSRTVPVQVRLGAVASAAVSMQTVASGDAPLALQPGEGRLFTSTAELACIRLVDAGPDARYLIVPQNAAAVPGPPFGFALTGLGGTTITTPPLVNAPATHAAGDRELDIRRLEQAFATGSPPIAAMAPALAVADPQVGDRRDFSALDDDNGFVRITAEVKAVSQHVILYQDLEAPAGGLTPADFNAFGVLFDDPIHDVVTGAFGHPSDIDGNGRIIVLFTPRVNDLSEPSGNSFIAGYFFGCDLVSRSRCSGTNSAEIFYSMVPDPSGFHGFRHSRQTVLHTVPGILAHEFQHMIHWGRTGELDALWLSEGLAHMAEDLVGDELLARADTAAAIDFKIPNFNRAVRYLQEIDETSIIAPNPPGGLPLRGGAWMLVKHVGAHHGGQNLFFRLTGSARSGIANVEAETGQAWNRLLSDFGVALWADGEPLLDGVPLNPRFTYPDFDVRRVLGQFEGGFPLVPATHAWIDFSVAGQLPAVSQRYHLLSRGFVPPGQVPLHLSFSGLYGAPFPVGSSPQLTLLRVR